MEVNVIDEKTVETEIIQETEEEKKETDVKVEESKLTPEQEKFERKKLTARQRISELSHKVRSKEAVIAEKDKKIQELESKISIVPQVPNPQRFINDDGIFNETEYAKAMSNYTEKLVESKMPKLAITPEADEVNPIEAWENIAGKVTAKYPDFRQAVEKEVFKSQLAIALYERALEDIEDETTVSAELSYYLGKNETEAKRLSDLPQKQMLIELGKLEGKLESLNKKTSQALEPIEPVGGNDGVVKDNEIKDDDEWYKRWKKEQLKKINTG